MKTIQFKKDTEIEDRLYLAGQSHEFDDAVAKQAIDDGNAVDPDAKKSAKGAESGGEPTTQETVDGLAIDDSVSKPAPKKTVKKKA